MMTKIERPTAMMASLPRRRAVRRQCPQRKVPAVLAAGGFKPPPLPVTASVIPATAAPIPASHWRRRLRRASRTRSLAIFSRACCLLLPPLDFACTLIQPVTRDRREDRA